MDPHRVSTARLFRTVLVMALSASALVLVATRGWGQQGPTHVDPQINKQFTDPNVRDFVKRFESESREVYAQREAIVAALRLKPGMAVADIGAGTGLFTRLMAGKVGTEGTVYAVDISAPFLKHITDESKRLGQPQVKTIRAAQNRTNLPPGSVDLAFICDVYHHVEQPAPWLATLHTALRPEGRLVLIEFDRTKPGASAFVKSHVRADREHLIKEVAAAGFEPIPTPGAPELKENFFQSFRKTAASATQP
jgi:ubiquinone/menaquinone biosynthesis C-methylase UbiE